jgi:hypothetical protein
MRNPRFNIPLSDLEGQMAMPNAGQAILLSDTLESALKQYKPRSVAVLGCAEGYGFG